jgi:putative copper resistance protein D
VEISGWDVGAVAAKLLVYAATLGASGAVFFLSYAGGLLSGAQRAAIRRIVAIQLIVAALFTLLRILLLTGAMSDSFAGMFDRDMAGMLLEAGEGTAASVRLVGLALAGCALSLNRRLQIPALAGAVIAASSFTWVGHVRALHPLLPATLFSCLHLVGVAFWVGALLPLLWSTRESALEVGALAKRFGTLAVSVVFLLVVAGLCMLWMLSYGQPEFWSSGYGTMIAVKLLLVSLLLGAAALNKLWLTPRLMNGEARAVVVLRRSIQFELLTALLILVVTASFTSLTGPPR